MVSSLSQVVLPFLLVILISTCSNAKLLMLPEEHVGAVLGIVNLLFGLLRVSRWKSV